AEFAASLDLHVVEVLGVEIVGMRIERGQHAINRALDQRLVADIVNIIRPHELENVAEQVELLIRFRGVRRSGADILMQRKQKDRAGSRRDQPQSLHSRTLWPPSGSLRSTASGASHGWGSTGRPSRRNSKYNTPPEPSGMA